MVLSYYRHKLKGVEYEGNIVPESTNVSEFSLGINNEMLRVILAWYSMLSAMYCVIIYFFISRMVWPNLNVFNSITAA